MDCEKLILLVQARKYLWDPREANYHMRNVQKRLWDEVSKEMKEPVEELKKKWRGLRDTYRKEFLKHMKNKSNGGDASLMPSWPFFSQLSFLGTIIKSKSIENNAPPVKEEIISDEDSANNYLATEFVAVQDLPSTPQIPDISHCENVDSHQQTTTSSTTKKIFKSPPKKRKTSFFDEKLLELESKKVKYLEQKVSISNDGDYQFLMSLLPYLQDIPKQRKLFVRQKMMGVVMEECCQQESSHSTSSCSPHSN